MIFDIFKKEKIDENKVENSFKKVKEDIDKLDLMIKAIRYEKDYIKRNQGEIKDTLKKLIEHYSSAIKSYNSLHNSHDERIKNIETNISEMKNIFNEISVFFEKEEKEKDERAKQLDTIMKENQNLKKEVYRLKSAIAAYIRSNNETMEAVINKIKEAEKNPQPITKPRIIPENTQKTHQTNIFASLRNELTGTEKQLLVVLSHLSTEFNNEIPIRAIIDEFYNGDKRKASTLSTYLTHLEKSGIIEKEKIGRETSISLTNEAIEAFNQ